MSENRKLLYYLGGGLMAVGFLLFISNFFLLERGSFVTAPIGMILMMAGAFMRNVGARGAAGSGLILDPKQAREDLKPWAKTAGGLVKDALDEVPLAAKNVEVVKVRCPKCRALNDEDARFCKQCGATM